MTEEEMQAAAKLREDIQKAKLKAKEIEALMRAHLAKYPD